MSVIMEYQIVDTDTFSKASARVKRSVEKIIEDMKAKGLDITPTGGGRNKGLQVDIIKMFKEGSIFKKYIYTGDMPIIAIILGVKHYYLEMRVSILNLNLKAVNLYYSHVIGFFDIQNLTRFPKDKQEVVISDILHNTTIKTSREERVTIYNKYNTRSYRKLNTKNWKRTRGPRKNIEPIGNILNEINLVKPKASEKKFNGWCSFEGCEYPFGVIHSHLHPIIEKKEINRAEFTTAEKLLKEKEYYDNLEMVIPANAIIEDVD